MAAQAPQGVIPFNFGPNLIDFQKCGRGIIRVGAAFGVANAATNFSIKGLGRIPVMFLVLNINAGASVYATGGDIAGWTNVQITLRASGISTATLYIN